MSRKNSHWKEMVEMQRQRAQQQASVSSAHPEPADEEDEEEVSQSETGTTVSIGRSVGQARTLLQRYRYAAISACVCFFALSLFAALRPPQRADLDLVRVAGQVLLDGQPLTNGVINFVPDYGRGSTSLLDEQGRFALTCLDGRDGAVLGMHSIEIAPDGPPADLGIQWLLPRSLANWQTSGERLEITGPVRDLKIELTMADYPPMESGDADPSALRGEPY
jgi:hypothetical protein